MIVNFEFSSASATPFLRIDEREESNMPQIMREWIDRNHAIRKSIRVILPGCEMSGEQQFADEYGMEHDDLLDFQDDLAKRPYKKVAEFRVTFAGVNLPDNWKKHKTAFPASYENTRIYHLVLAANQRRIERYNQVRAELSELGYSEQALNSVPLKSQEQMDREEAEYEKLAKSDRGSAY